MRSVNIVVAMISMAAGAWQGTTESWLPGTAEHGRTAVIQLTLRGCVQKGTATGTYLLITAILGTVPGLDPAASPAPPSETVTYELVAATPEVDLASLVGKRAVARGTPERTAIGATADDGPGAAAAAADTPAGNTASTGTTGTSDHAGATSPRSRVRVATIEPIGGSCE